MNILPASIKKFVRKSALVVVDSIVRFKRWTEQLFLPHEGRVKPGGDITLVALRARFPRYLAPPSGHALCEKGWYPLVWDLCTAIEAMEHLGMPKVGYVLAEERLGGLFVQVGSGSLLVKEVVRDIEHKAAATCEECGAPGSLRLGHGFAKTLCPEHAKIRKHVRHNTLCVQPHDPTPTLLFLDAEFTDLEYPQLISIGLVAESGERFYAELTDGWSPHGCSSFVVNTVLPLLFGGDYLQERAYAARRLAEWLSDFCGTVRVVSDAPAYDWVLMKDLLAQHMPANLIPEPLPLFSESFPELVPLLQEAKKSAFKERQPHHSLNDAEALRETWEVMRINVHPAIMAQYLRQQ